MVNYPSFFCKTLKNVVDVTILLYIEYKHDVIINKIMKRFFTT